MHLGISILMIFVVWRWSDWRNWKKYHSTMIFLSFIDLVYEFISGLHNYYLWKWQPEVFLKYEYITFLWIFVIFPSIVLVFLSNYPCNRIRQIIYIFAWVQVFSITEWFCLLYNKIIHQHGWNIFYSFIFDIIMFTGVRLHYKKTLFAYVAFIIITLLGIWGFNIPILH